MKIRFVKNQPPTTWNMYAPDEYGFYSNVNPNRGSSALEPGNGAPPRAGTGLFTRPIPTLMFNGYGDQVASMYAGMDLRKKYY